MSEMQAFKFKIVDFPHRTCAINEANALWIIAVAPGLEEKYSCEYDQEIERWRLRVQSSTFQGAAALVERCRHLLGWDIPINEAKAEVRS